MINQNETAAELVSGLGYQTWVVIHDTTDYGKGHNKYFSEQLTARGGEILGTFGVTADQQDFTAELTQAKALDPDVIYFGGLTPLGIRIRQQMDRLGIDALFQGTSGIVSDAFIDGLGPLAEGALAFREGAPVEKLPGGQFFMEQYEKAGYGEPPEAYGPFAFAAMELVLDVIEEVGPDREAIIEDEGHQGPRLDRGSDHLRRPRPERGAADHQVRRPGRRVGGLGGQRIRERPAQARRPRIDLATLSAGVDPMLQSAAGVGPTWHDGTRDKSVSMDLGLLGQFVVNGLMLGMMYALVAVGFTLFFGVLDVIKFSHGDVLTVGAFAGPTWLGLLAIGVTSPWLQIAAVVLVASSLMGLLGVLIASSWCCH